MLAQSLNFPCRNEQEFFADLHCGWRYIGLNVTIYNPNAFQLTNASWTDNLIGVQPGLVIAKPDGMTNSLRRFRDGGSWLDQVFIKRRHCTLPQIGISRVMYSLPQCDLDDRRKPDQYHSAGACPPQERGANITNTSPASATLNVARDSSRLPSARVLARAPFGPGANQPTFHRDQK